MLVWEKNATFGEYLRDDKIHSENIAYFIL